MQVDISRLMKNKLTIQNSHLRGSVFAIQLLAKQNFRNFFVFVEITILIQINVINDYRILHGHGYHWPLPSPGFLLSTIISRRVGPHMEDTDTNNCNKYNKK